MKNQSHTIMRASRLEGRAVADWFERDGRRFRAGAEQSVALIDAIHGAHIAIERIWQTPGQFLFPGSERGDGYQYALLLVEGGVSISVDGVSHGLDKLEWVVLPRGTASQIAFLQNSAYYLARVSTAHLPLLRIPGGPGHVMTGASRLSAAFTGLVNGFFAEPVQEVGDHALQAYLVASETLIEAIVLDVSQRDGERGAWRSHDLGREESLVAEATARMRERYRDADFTVQVLASELGVSRDTLYRAFARLPLSPASQLRELRRSAVRKAIGDRSLSSVSNVGELARACGYRSAAALRRAFAEQEPREAE